MEEKDEVIYERYRRKRDSDDLRILLERYRESLTLFLYGYLHNMEDAEEVMLDAFAEAAASSGFSGRSSFKTWLYGIGRNLAVSRFNRGKIRLLFRHPDSEECLDEIPAEETPEMEILKQERTRQLKDVLDQMTPDYRQALWLQYFEELDVEETARVMGKSKKQIYNLTHRGKQMLKDRLEELGITP